MGKKYLSETQIINLGSMNLFYKQYYLILDG